MYRRPKFLTVLIRIREIMSREADYDVDLFAEMVRSGKQPEHGAQRNIRGFRKRYRAYWAKYQRKPLFYRGKDKWTPIPREFL